MERQKIQKIKIQIQIRMQKIQIEIQMQMQKIQVPAQMFDRSPASIDIICGQKSRDPCNARPKHNGASHIKDSTNKQNTNTNKRQIQIQGDTNANMSD